jgi:hypothetical protein
LLEHANQAGDNVPLHQSGWDCQLLYQPSAQSRERTWEVPPVVVHEVVRRVQDEVSVVSQKRQRSDQTRQLSLLLSLFYSKHAKERINSAQSMAEKYVDREHMLNALLYREFRENLVEVQNGEFARSVVTVVRDVVQEQVHVMATTPPMSPTFVDDIEKMPTERSLSDVLLFLNGSTPHMFQLRPHLNVVVWLQLHAHMLSDLIGKDGKRVFCPRHPVPCIPSM